MSLPKDFSISVCSRQSIVESFLITSLFSSLFQFMDKMTKGKCDSVTLYPPPVFSPPSQTGIWPCSVREEKPCAAASLSVNLAYLPSRPWYCCYRSIHPPQLHRPSSCLVPFQGILTPPLASQGGRSGAKYRKCCVSPSFPPNASHPFASLQRAPITRPRPPALIHHCHHSTRFRPGVTSHTVPEAFEENTPTFVSPSFIPI